MHTSGALTGRKVPMEFEPHAIGDGVAIQPRFLRRVEGNDANVWASDDPQPLYLPNACSHGPGGPNDPFCGLDVAFLPELAHRGPSPRNNATSARSRHRWRAVNAARPSWHARVHVVAPAPIREHHHRRALRREPILVRVTRDRSHPLYSEVERRQGETGLRHEGHEKAAEATIHVEPNVFRQGQRGHFLDGVDGASGKLATRPDDCHGVAVDETLHVPHVHLLLCGRPALPHEYVEVLARLEESSMRRGADNYVGLGDTFLGQPPIPVDLHGHQNALCATRGEGTTTSSVPVVHVNDHLNDLRVHLAQGWMDGRMQRVGERPLRDDLPNEIVMRLPPVVN
mmetsp:Transcript_108923/g.306960  ORF Transcript_108923/g.306960 Transcript_108923/m.306960 type:complete len:341 (-) Transcript_108923:410-1432(-)